MKGKSQFPELNDEKWLIQKYSVEILSSYEIAKIVGSKGHVTVLNALKRFNISPHDKARKGEANGMFGVHLSGEKNGNWKGGKVKSICLECGHTFSIVPSKLKNGSGKFCSQKCKGVWHSKNLIGQNNPCWKSKKFICPVCGKEFFRNPSQISSPVLYCSLKCSRKSRHIPKHHTKPEMIFEAICKKNNLPFKYTGDGSFWIGKNPSVNPDFVECNGKKIAIEVFGNYWHSPLLNHQIGEDRTLHYRKRTLKKYGWKLVVLWELDLKREDAEQFVLHTLKGAGLNYER